MISGISGTEPILLCARLISLSPSKLDFSTSIRSISRARVRSHSASPQTSLSLFLPPPIFFYLLFVFFSFSLLAPFLRYTALIKENVKALEEVRDTRYDPLHSEGDMK